MKPSFLAKRAKPQVGWSGNETQQTGHGQTIRFSTLSNIFSGSEPFAQVVADLILKDCLALTTITVFELYTGVLGSKRLGQIDDLISAVTVLSLGMEDALAAVGIYNDLKRAGQLIGIQDILIAGICIARKRPLLTRNREHFSRIPALKLTRLP